MDIFLYRSYFKTPDLSIVGHSETIVFITPSPIPRCRPGPLGPGHHTPLVSDQLEDVAALSSQLSGPNLHVGSHFCMHTIVHFFLWHFLSFPSCQDSPCREKANYPLQRCIPNLLCGAKELVCDGSPIAFVLVKPSTLENRINSSTEPVWINCSFNTSVESWITFIDIFAAPGILPPPLPPSPPPYTVVQKGVSPLRRGTQNVSKDIYVCYLDLQEYGFG